MSGCSSEAVLEHAGFKEPCCVIIKRKLSLPEKGESGDIYLAHLEQMLSVTLACGSG